MAEIAVCGCDDLPRVYGLAFEGKLQSNYRVGRVYAERQAIYKEGNPESVSIQLPKTSSVPPPSVAVYSRKHFDMIYGRLWPRVESVSDQEDILR